MGLLTRIAFVMDIAPYVAASARNPVSDLRGCDDPPLAFGDSNAEHVDGVDVVVRLATNAESTDQRAITLYVAFLHVVQQSTALTDELHESAAGVVITLVDLEVLGEMRDPVGQERDLDLGRAGVGVVGSKVLDDLLLLGHNLLP
jgi:hypothetical protein